MIQYENISSEDMRAYWGDGIILVPQTNEGGLHYNAYQSDIEKGRVILHLVDGMDRYGDPPAVITWKYEQFFRNALLHRPHLGVVISDGNVYSLGWQHANGMQQGKALQSRDIHVTELHRAPDEKVPEKAAELPAWHIHWTTLYTQRTAALLDGAFDISARRHIRLGQISEAHRELFEQHPLNGRGPEKPNAQDAGMHKNALSLVLKYLNQKPMSVQELQQVPDGVYYLRDTLWARKIRQVCVLSNASMVMGTVLFPHMELAVAQTKPVLVAACRLAFNELLNQENYNV